MAKRRLRKWPPKVPPPGYAEYMQERAVFHAKFERGDITYGEYQTGIWDSWRKHVDPKAQPLL